MAKNRDPDTGKFITVEHAEKLAKNLKKSAEQGKAFADTMAESSFHANNIIDQINEIAKESAISGENFRQFSAASRSLSKGLSENVDILDKIKEGELNIHEVQKAQAKQKVKARNLEKAANNLEKDLKDKMITGLSKKESRAMGDQIKGMRARAAEGNTLMDEAVSKAAKGNTNMSKGLRGMGGIMDKMGQKGLGKTFKGMAGSVSKAKLAGGGFAKQMMAAGKAAKLNPYMIIASIIIGLVKMLIAANNESAAMGREFGVSAAAAGDIRNHFIDVSASMGRLGVEYRDIATQNTSLNKSLGTSSILHKDITGEAAVYVKRMHGSQEAAVGMMQAALATKKTTAQISDEAMTGARQAAKELGVRANIKDIMDDTLKVGGQLRGIYGANMELIGKAVGKAKLLGMTLGDVASNSRNMLDFHSSIEKEMEAELFLGRQLNLEQARLAAMTGNHSKYMDEVVKNAGNFFEFSELNVLQQDKLAAAMGMSSDSLADMLFQRENLASLQEAALNTTNADLKAKYEQLSVQEKFNAVIEKLKYVVINLVNRLEKNISESFFLKHLLGVKESDFQMNPFGDSGEGTTTGDGRPVVGKANSRIKVNDFQITTHPKDTLVMAGGTKLGDNNNNSMTQQQANELINVSKSNRTFEYSGFAAVKESGHYGTRFS
tara:strand:+ start:1788 stop:3776 length:1989 start_codon:yes stop_codon:yes gene_type:complete